MSKLIEILIVLGSPNSSEGKLSSISIDRLNHCIQHFKEGKFILCTGGFGAHFNTTLISHATYAKTYLRSNNISENCFLESAISSNTVEDAVKVKSILSKLSNIKLTVISSDYHIKRVEHIFNEILKEYPKKYIGVKSSLDLKELNILSLHEKNALNSILKNGLYY